MGPCSVPKFILFPSFLSSLPLISVSSKDRESSVSSLRAVCHRSGACLLPVGGGVSAPTRQTGLSGGGRGGALLSVPCGSG